MRVFDISPTQFRVGDFVGWQRDKTLDLNPTFQRRSVWRLPARSYLLDTVVRGLPVPLIFLRERVELSSQRITREVVDGQQRLRSLFAFVDPGLLDDFKPARDEFTIQRNHNREIAGQRFSQLDAFWQSRILGYKFSVQILPAEIEDREVLQIFARLNSTGLKLTGQELRNAAYFGSFKTMMYDLGYEQFERWRRWDVVSDDEMTRMVEVEITSDLAMSMIDGLTGKTQKRLDALYARFDDQLPQAGEFIRRFRKTMDTVDDLLGSDLSTTVYRDQVHFFTLCVYIYDRLYGLGSDLVKQKIKPVPTTLRSCLLEASRRFREQDVPKAVLDAVTRASADTGRRQTRLDFLRAVCDGPAR